MLAAISGDGEYSFGITKATADDAAYGSKESLNVPELVLEIGEIPIARLASSPAREIGAAAGDEVVGTRGGALPSSFALAPTHPNPFRHRATIEYALPVATNVRLLVYNVQGQVVRRLVDGPERPGYKSTLWNGRDDAGRAVASGVYFLRLEAAGQRMTKKVLLRR